VFFVLVKSHSRRETGDPRTIPIKKPRNTKLSLKSGTLDPKYPTYETTHEYFYTGREKCNFHTARDLTKIILVNTLSSRNTG